MERTLSIIKPDAVAAGNAGKVIAAIEEAGLEPIAMKMVHLSAPEAQGFYHVHRERPFFDDLVSFMTSGPCVVMCLEGKGAIKKYRKLMGATNPEDADDGTLRKRFATNIERNAVHGSDAPETASFEVSYFFSDLELHPRTD